MTTKTECILYILFQTLWDELGCAEQKAIKLLSELDIKKGIGLIERKRQGLGKPNIIYVKNFIYQSTPLNCENHNSRVVNIENQELRFSQFSNCENQSSEIVKNTNQELRFSQQIILIINILILMILKRVILN